MKSASRNIPHGMKRLLSVIAPVLVLSLTLVTPALPANDLLAVGSKAPNFTLQSQEGKSISLKNFRGQWVVLYFYPKDMTAGCTIEAHNFQRDLAQFKAKKAAIVGVSADTIDSHQQFCTKESLTFRLLADPDKKVISEYGSLAPNGKMAARNTFLIDPQGMIRKIYTKVDPNVHSGNVLTELAELEK